MKRIVCCFSLLPEYRKKLKQLPRKWELTAFGEVYNCHHRVSRNSRQPVEFKVMTYNILSQDLLENHSYLYSGSKSRSLDWRHRRRRLIAEIACHNPDVSLTGNTATVVLPSEFHNPDVTNWCKDIGQCSVIALPATILMLL